MKAFHFAEQADTRCMGTPNPSRLQDTAGAAAPVPGGALQCGVAPGGQAPEPVLDEAVKLRVLVRVLCSCCCGFQAAAIGAAVVAPLSLLQTPLPPPSPLHLSGSLADAGATGASVAAGAGKARRRARAGGGRGTADGGRGALSRLWAW